MSIETKHNPDYRAYDIKPGHIIHGMQVLKNGDYAWVVWISENEHIIGKRVDPNENDTIKPVFSLILHDPKQLRAMAHKMYEDARAWEAKNKLKGDPPI